MKMISRNTDSIDLDRAEILISHADEEMVWDISSFEKKSFTEFDMFYHINLYWKSFSEQNQLNIFNIYKEIREAFNMPWSRNELTAHLYSLVAKLLDAHDLGDAQHWILFHSGVYFPPDLKVEYINTTNNPGSREQTYLKDDYIRLVTLTLVLRTMIPIWGEFISKTKKEAGNNFKEYYAFQLICKSKLAYSEAIEKLTTYIEYSIVPDKSKSASIVGGISTEDFPIWVLGLVLVRRLCLGDISGVNQKATLITFLYKFITQRIKGNDNNFAGMVKDKIFDDSGSDGDSNISKLEGYKAKQEIPAGDIILLEYAMRDVYALVDKLAPSMDRRILARALQTTQILNDQDITDPQIVILQWVMKPVISPRGILYLGKGTIIRLLALCQAVLVHRGHYAIAGLCTSIVKADNDDAYNASGVDSRARIPKNLLEELAIYYPFTKRGSGKQKVTKPINYAVASIDEIEKQLSSRNWFLTVDDSLLPFVTSGTDLVYTLDNPPEIESLSRNSTNRRYIVQHNFKITLANLVLEIAKRNWRL